MVNSGKLDITRVALFWRHPATLAAILSILTLVVVPAAALRWWLLLRAMGIRMPIGRSLLLTWIGNFFNTALPGSISGDFVKGYYIIDANRGGEKAKAFTTLVIDRFTGLFGLVVMAFIALLFNWPLILAQPQLQPLAAAVAALFAATVFFYGIVLYRFGKGSDPFITVLNALPKSAFFLNIYTTFKSYQHHKNTLLATLVLSIGIHAAIAAIFAMIAGMIGVGNLGAALQSLIMPVGLIAIAVPIAPSGVGVGHVAFDSLYAIGGISGGADIFNLYLILQIAVYLLGGIAYFLYNSKYKIP